MRRPHRSLPERMEKAAQAVGRRLPPPVRRQFRRVAAGPVDRRLARFPADVADSFDAWGAQDGLATTILEVLEASGIPAVRLSRSGQEWLAVDLDRQAAAVEALQRAPRTARLIVEPQPSGRPRRLASLRPDGPRDLLVFRHLRSASGDYVCGREISVTLQFWRALPHPGPRPDGGRHTIGTRIPPSRNRVAPYLSAVDWDEACSRPDHRLPAQTRSNLLEFTDPVDVVYTWVDDSDPEWARRRAAFPPGEDGLAADALDAARTRDRRELLYSLRSLAMYAGWVRRIWIVTDHQVPEWLSLDDPRIEVISHQEIFADASVLPVFNSHAIESQLHHIPGLAEHFLYLNDDFFFGRPVRPEAFFHGNGLPKVMLSSIAVDLDHDTDARNGAMLAARRGRERIEHLFGRTVSHRMQHVPHAHLKSVLEEMEHQLASEVARVAASRYRHREDLSIPSDLGHYYAYATGRAVTGSLSYRYVDTDSELAPEHLAALLAERSADCFCLNDVGGGTSIDALSEDVSRFLSAYFPLPSPFERSRP